MIEDYFRVIADWIAASGVIRSPTVLMERRDDEIGFLRGDILFTDGSHLHFREFVQQEQGKTAKRYTYAYHYMRADGGSVFRYDNSPHYPRLSSAPHHKHVGDEEVIACEPPDLYKVLLEIESLVES